LWKCSTTTRSPPRQGADKTQRVGDGQGEELREGQALDEHVAPARTEALPAAIPAGAGTLVGHQPRAKAVAGGLCAGLLKVRNDARKRCKLRRGVPALELEAELALARAVQERVADVLGQVLRRRRDPAPSRWAYRLNRLWLTPLFRRLVLRGLPALLLAGLLGSWLAPSSERY